MTREYKGHTITNRTGRSLDYFVSDSAHGRVRRGFPRKEGGIW